MEKQNILSADLLDILFEGKNKTYGAYELRKSYEKRITYAMSGTFLICLLFIGGSILAGNKKVPKIDIVVGTMELEGIKKEEKKIEPQKPLPKPEEKIAMVKDVVPLIVKDDEVKPEDEIKDLKDLEVARIGNFDQEGKKDDERIAPPVEKDPGVVEAPRKEDDIDKVLPIVQIEAQFPGGIGQWSKYLERNLNKDLPSENGAPPADYAVIVSFIVDRNGVISDVKAENDPGYGTKAEAIRVIQKGPNWTPAQQNGRAVVYRQKQKITFRVSEQ